jgi:hypothetical protein
MQDQPWNERWLGWTGTDQPAVAAGKLRSIRRLLLLTIACEAWLALRYVPYSSRPAAYGLVATALVVTLIAGWQDRLARPAVAAAFVLLLGVVLSVFPENANHQFLALLLLAILLLACPSGDESSRDTEAALQSMRWIAIIGIGWAGVMKLYYGYWLEGEFLGFRIAGDPGFAQTLGLLVPEPELSRLIGLGTDVGAGPFRPEAPLLVAVSNFTWLAELLLPLGLVWRRTRGPAMIATIVLMIAIELGAREIFFGGMMIGLLLLFAHRDRVATALPWIAAVYLLWLLNPDLVGWLEKGTNP